MPRNGIRSWSSVALLGTGLAAVVTWIPAAPLAATERAALVVASPRPALRREVERLTRSLLDLEGAGPGIRNEVEAWITKGVAEVVREGDSGPAMRTGDEADVRSRPPVGSNPTSLAEEVVLTRFLGWLKRPLPSGDPRAWKLSGLAHGKAGSCLALVCAATIFGRSAGLDVHPVAVPDHVILQIGTGLGAELIDPLEGVRTVDRRNAPARYRVPDPPGSAFPRPLSDRELLACVLIERGAESYEAGRVRQAASDLKRAIRWFPDHPSGYYNLGLVEESRKRWTRAEPLLSRAIVLNPLDSRVWQHRAFVRVKDCRHPEARNDLREALRLDPQLAGAAEIGRLLTVGCSESHR